MAVYVDDVRHRFGRMIMCHMWADDEAELHTMADRIGVARKWCQRPPKASWVHYDISLAKKRLALNFGAILTDMFGPVEHLARQDISEGRAIVGGLMLERVRRSREKRSTGIEDLL